MQVGGVCLEEIKELPSFIEDARQGSLDELQKKVAEADVKQKFLLRQVQEQALCVDLKATTKKQRDRKEYQVQRWHVTKTYQHLMAGGFAKDMYLREPTPTPSNIEFRFASLVAL